MSPMNRKPWIIGNWKMNGNLQDNLSYFEQLKNDKDIQKLSSINIGLAIPYPYLAQAQQHMPSAIVLGAQDISPSESGARTSEVSGAMLNDFDCRFTLVGHSERRQFWQESSAVVAAKANQALSHAITPVICIGENEEQRHANEVEKVLEQQLTAVTSRLEGDINQCIIAYEPVWAIGTGKTASPQIAQAVHAFIRSLVEGDVPILYGGSVNMENSTSLFNMPDIDGVLVGGASLEAASFLNIIKNYPK